MCTRTRTYMYIRAYVHVLHRHPNRDAVTKDSVNQLLTLGKCENLQQITAVLTICIPSHVCAL
jgi:hypothetical protein